MKLEDCCNLSITTAKGVHQRGLVSGAERVANLSMGVDTEAKFSWKNVRATAKYSY